MTDEERRECVEALRGFKYLNWLDKAADEIERLTAEVERLTTLMSGNVRLVEELDDGAIFEISPTAPRLAR
jgi:hypothetical protein